MLIIILLIKNKRIFKVTIFLELTGQFAHSNDRSTILTTNHGGITFVTHIYSATVYQLMFRNTFEVMTSA